MDWGNKETLEEAALRELPEELRLIEKQCLKAKLFLTKPIRNPNYLERIRGELMNQEEYLFKKEVGEFISSYKNKQNINLSLIERGIVKSNTVMADQKTRTLIREFEEVLRENNIGIWEEQSEEEDLDMVDLD